jgi:hypothetical protein
MRAADGRSALQGALEPRDGRLVAGTNRREGAEKGEIVVRRVAQDGSPQLISKRSTGGGVTARGELTGQALAILCE